MSSKKLIFLEKQFHELKITKNDDIKRASRISRYIGAGYVYDCLTLWKCSLVWIVVLYFSLMAGCAFFRRSLLIVQFCYFFRRQAVDGRILDQEDEYLYGETVEKPSLPGEEARQEEDMELDDDLEEGQFDLCSITCFFLSSLLSCYDNSYNVT